MVPAPKALTTPKSFSDLKSYAAFMAAGGVGFLLALVLNYYLAEIINKPLAYGLALIVQVHVNYLFCTLFIFKKEGASPEFSYSNYFKFMSGILAFRVMDWGLYSLLSHTTSIHISALQTLNLLLFSVLKYLYVKRILK